MTRKLWTKIIASGASLSVASAALAHDGPEGHGEVGSFLHNVSHQIGDYWIVIALVAAAVFYMGWKNRKKV